MVIYGMIEIGFSLVKYFCQFNDYDIDVIGFVDDCLEWVFDECEDVFLFGNVDSLFQLVCEGYVDQVIVVFFWSVCECQRDIFKKFVMMLVYVWIVLDLVGMEFFISWIMCLGGLLMLVVFDMLILGWVFVVKFIEDKMLVVFMFVVLVFVMVLIVFVIKLDLKGLVIFK